jgi:hypothetical protein
MKLIYIITLILLATCTSCRYSWTIEKLNNRYSLVRDFKNQGEQEDYWTRRAFKKEYKKMSFNTYEGGISITKTEGGINIKFDSALISLSDNDSIFSQLFTSRLIQPEILGCNSLEGHGILINELSDIETKHKKRFSLWVWQPNCMNPQVVLIEIYNRNCNSKKKLREFITGAKLTFVYHGWVII